MALAAKELESLLHTLHEKPAEKFAEQAAGHHRILEGLLKQAGYDDYDAAMDAFMAEAKGGGDQTPVYDTWTGILEAALAASRKPFEKFKQAVRGDGRPRPDKAAEELRQGVENAAGMVGSIGRAGWLTLRVVNEAGLALHRGMKAGANGIAAAHEILPMTKPMKLAAAGVLFGFMANHLFIDTVAPPAFVIENSGIQAEDLHPSPFCQNPAMWHAGGKLTAAWSVESYRAGDRNNHFYQMGALAGLQQGIHPLALWTLMGAETGFRDVIGSIASGMTQNLPATFLDKLRDHLTDTHFYRNLEQRVETGQAGAQEQELKTRLDEGLSEYTSHRGDYLAQLRRDDPRIGPAVAYLMSLVHHPEIAMQVEAADLLQQHPDLATERFDPSVLAFQELFFEVYDSHLPGRTGEMIMDYAVENGYGDLRVDDRTGQRAMLAAFSRDVRSLHADVQERLSGFFARVVRNNPGPFRGVSDMQGFYDGLRRYTDQKVEAYALPSFDRAEAMENVAALCVSNPAVMDNPAITGVSRAGYTTMIALNYLGLRTSDVQNAYQTILGQIMGTTQPAMSIEDMISQNGPTAPKQ